MGSTISISCIFYKDHTTYTTTATAFLFAFSYATDSHRLRRHHRQRTQDPGMTRPPPSIVDVECCQSQIHFLPLINAMLLLHDFLREEERTDETHAYDAAALGTITM